MYVCADNYDSLIVGQKSNEEGKPGYVPSIFPWSVHKNTHTTETSSRTRVPLQPLNGPLDHHHYADSKSGVIIYIFF